MTYKLVNYYLAIIGELISQVTTSTTGTDLVNPWITSITGLMIVLATFVV